MLASKIAESDFTMAESPSIEAVFQAHGQIRTVKKNGLIFSPGDHPDYAFLISSGEVKISRYTPEGRELTLDHLGPGAIFGEQEILLDTIHQSQAIARSGLVLFAIEREKLLDLAQQDTRISLGLSRQMSLRQSRMESRLESLLFKSANGKVAQLLLDLATDHGVSTGQGTLIDYPITHQEIGNLIATTRETVSYAFMEFRGLGVISTRQRKTIVKDMEGLSAIAAG